MRGAPGFKQWPDPVDGMWKIELLRYLGKVFDLSILVETGTCEGVTPFFLHDDFRDIYTIELHPGLYENAKQRLKNFPNVHQYLGNSVSYLPNLLELDVPYEPVLFWLDAHPCGPHSADEGDPLADELRIIMDMRPNALIVIDDIIDPEMSEWKNKNNFSFGDWVTEHRTGELIVYRQGEYVIPSFED